MKHRSIILISLICFLFFGFITQPKPVVAAGNTYYVAKTGSDSNPGTFAQPWLTPQHALNTMWAGDITYIEAGTYSSTQINTVHSGTAGNYITLQNYNNDTVNIAVTSSTYNGFNIANSYVQLIGLNFSAPSSNVCLEIYSGSYITIQNCSFSNCKSSGIEADSPASYITLRGCTLSGTNTTQSNECISFYSINQFEIANCIIHDPASINRVGIDTKQGCSNGSIHDNEVYNLSGTMASGIYIDAYNAVTSNISVYDNEIHNCSGEGIALGDENTTANVTNISIYNNLIYNNTRRAFTVNQHTTETYNFSFVNNTCYNNGVAAEIAIWSTHPYLNSCIIRNNIIFSTVAITDGILYADYANGGVTVDHNLSYNSGGSWAPNNLLGTSYITGNPLLTNPTSNFDLKTGSPAIDTGSSVGVPSMDITSTPRPQGSGCDIGAYEY